MHTQHFKCVNLITVEKVKTGTFQLCRSTPQRSVTSWWYYQNIVDYQNNKSIIIAYSVDFIFLIFSQTRYRSFLDTLYTMYTVYYAQNNSRACEITLANEILTLLCLYLRLWSVVSGKWWETKEAGNERTGELQHECRAQQQDNLHTSSLHTHSCSCCCVCARQSSHEFLTHTLLHPPPPRVCARQSTHEFLTHTLLHPPLCVCKTISTRVPYTHTPVGGGGAGVCVQDNLHKSALHTITNPYTVHEKRGHLR